MEVKVKVLQSCPTLGDPVDYSGLRWTFKYLIASFLVASICSLFWSILPQTWWLRTTCALSQSPRVRIWPWLSWMSGIRWGCRLTCWLSWGRINLLSAQVCGHRQTSVPHGLKDGRPPLLPVGVSTGSPNLAASFIRREPWEEPGREGGIKRDRKRERGGKWIFFNLISVVILQYFYYIIFTKLSH